MHKKKKFCITLTIKNKRTDARVYLESILKLQNRNNYRGLLYSLPHGSGTSNLGRETFYRLVSMSAVLP